MSTNNIEIWLKNKLEDGACCYIKRLSGNDTGANGTHQAGPYIPKKLLFEIFPSLHDNKKHNPYIVFDLQIDSYSKTCQAKAIWYNNKYHGSRARNPRDETRLTKFGGASSPLLNHDNTGALAIFAFENKYSSSVECHVWICKNMAEENEVEHLVGPIEPGRWLIWPSLGFRNEEDIQPTPTISKKNLPSGWLKTFPSAQEIINHVTVLVPKTGLTPDQRLIRRRNTEFELFCYIEEAIELPKLQNHNVSCINDFLQPAQRIIQRRKSRSGRSLELHVQKILQEEGMVPGIDFDYQGTSESSKRPDFLFPSQVAYSNCQFPSENLRLLAVKTTCKDRWRQILNEADRIGTKHLLTLQEGLSENQFKEMSHANVKLVVPENIKSKYPQSIRSELQSLEEFISEVKTIKHQTSNYPR